MHRRVIRSLAARGLATALMVAALVGSGGEVGAEGMTVGGRLVGVVNVNTADAEALQSLPGIGPARARAIVEFRKTRGAFKKVEDLLQVSGIGEKALARIRPYCALEGKTTLRPPR